MKAVVCKKYGSPDVLELQEIEMPIPKSNEVRIRIKASVVCPSDCAFRKGEPFIVKMIYGLRKPKFPVMGTELAGEVESTGADVTKFKVGDQVIARSVKSFGTHAEYICLAEDTQIILQSDHMTHEQSAALCDGPPTALTFLRDVAKLQPRQTVLINGASGSVGIYAVQLAKYYGAKVTGVCSTRNLELVKSMGADEVIDYTTADFVQKGKQYDLIFDAVGKSSYFHCKGALAPRGVYMTTVPSWSIVVSMLSTLIFSRKKAKFATAGLMQSNDNLLFLKELFETDMLRPVIDRQYPLDQTAEAHRYVDTGRKRGNVIITTKQV